MNDFKGLSRDTAIGKTPQDMWQRARNILLTGKYLSVSNEKGNEYIYDVPGIVIGYEVTNEDIVYLSIDGAFSCIGYVNYHTNRYIPVIRTANPNFKFNLDCPIEIISLYNFKKELIIVFVDGVNSNSNSPKLINIHNPQVALTESKDFVNLNDYSLFELFTNNELPSTTIKYEKGSLDAEVVHISMAYIYDDNTEGLPTPILKTAYPNFKYKDKIKRNIIISLKDLSPIFKKIKLYFIVESDGARTAYETTALSVTNKSLSFTLSNVNTLKASNVSKILSVYERFEKVKTISKTSNQIILGWTTIADKFEFQKYANKLELGFDMITSEEEKEKYKGHPTFLPDEVYSFKIVPIFKKSGVRGDAYHLPGRQANGNERSPLDAQDYKKYGLSFPEFKDKGYKKFHLTNTGRVQDNIKEWGYWENENTYSNSDDYNSSSIGGEDLRGKPIRFHRFPSPSNISISGASFVPVINGIIADNIIDTLPKFNIFIKNFDEVVPLEVRNKLQGYEIVFEKRKKGGTYIEFAGIAYTYTVTNDKKYKIPGVAGEVIPHLNNRIFNTFTFLNPEVAKDKVEITANIVKMYSGILPGAVSKGIDVDGGVRLGTTNNNTLPILDSEETVAAIVDTEYKLANNIMSGNRFQSESLTIKVKHKVNDTDSSEFVPLLSSASNFNALSCALITLNKNLYNVEQSTDFISVGKIMFEKENEKLINGDVFLTSIIDKAFSGYRPLSINRFSAIHFFTPYYVYNIYSPLSNTFIKSGDMQGYSKNKANDEPFFSASFEEDVNYLNTSDFSTVVKEHNNKYFNDLEPTLSFSLSENYINKFPYRVYKGLNIPNESISTSNLRIFPSNQYYEMPNDKGEIVALRGFMNGIYIQQQFSLFTSTISDKLDSNSGDVYLGNTQLFDRIPEEVLTADSTGYIGSNNQFACTIIKGTYITVDAIQGKIFTVVGTQVDEITKNNNKNYFAAELPMKANLTKTSILGHTQIIDNPYVSIGYLIGLDKENNRLIFTKKDYVLKPEHDLSFNGKYYLDHRNQPIDYNNEYYFENHSLTYTFALDSRTWVSPHDYHQNGYITTNTGVYSIITNPNGHTKVYKHNSNNVNPGNYNGKQYESYVDLIFNTRVDLSKVYQSFTWVSESMDIPDEKLNQFDTIDKVIVYNDYQCSGIINVSKQDLRNSRNVEGKWQLNEFRDMMKKPNLKIFDVEGNLIKENIADKRAWYSKSNFVGTYIVIRMIWNNTTKRIKHIHNVTVKSINSQR